MASTHVVVGGGIAGMLAALLIAQRRDGQRVALIEVEGAVGGLLRSFDYGEYGHFDYGTHIIAETGESGLDALLFGLLPEDEWLVLEGNRRDLAGLYFNGRLQHNSLYMDLRALPPLAKAECLAGLQAAIDSREKAEPADAYGYALARFGEPIARRAIGPAVEKLFGRPAASMDRFATVLTSMERVILHDEAPFRELMKFDALRARVAYPEQRNLPARWASGKRSFYPKRYGMYRVIDALAERLRTSGVSILTRTKITQLKVAESRVEAATLDRAGTLETIEDVESVSWTIALAGLLPLLGSTVPLHGLDKPLKTVVVNLLLDRAPDMGDLYYFYCYDAGFKTFRVTQYTAYCPGALRAGGHPISVELLLGSDSPADAEAHEKIAADELSCMGVLKPGTRIVFSRAEALATGFPMPSLRNMQFLDGLRDQLRALGIVNLRTLGILSEPRLFFQRDVAMQTYRALAGALAA